jgi:nitroreductase/cell division protein FtsB
MLNQLKNLAYRLLADPRVRGIYQRTTSLLLRVGSSNRAASHSYHTVAPLAFSREQHAVLAGRLAYYQNLDQPRRTAVQLRRNIHRLEKGLLMRPPRPLFATDYIGETVEFFEAVMEAPADLEQDNQEICWATDVLEAYFERTAGQAAIADARTRFESARATGAPDEEKRVPYHRNADPLAVSYDDFLALNMRRRSVRWFLEEPVPRELIDKALLAARQAPTACNRMPYEFRLYDDPDLVGTVAAIPFGTGGYAENIPTIAVVTGRLDSYFSPRDRHAVYIDSSLASMAFMLALETVGLASCAINWPDFEPLERKMQRTLGLELHERPIMLIAIGYADPNGLVAYSQKKELGSFRSYNRIGSGD